MDSYVPYYFMSIVGFVWMFLLVGIVLFYALFVYFLAPSPNQFVSSVFIIKMYLVSILFTVVGVGGLLNDILAWIGFRSGSFSWDLHNVRQYIIYFILATFFFYVARWIKNKSTINPEMKEKKDAVTFTSHVCQLCATIVAVVLEAIALYMLLDYLLGFVLSGGYQPAFKDFLQNFLTLIAPVILLEGLLFKPFTRSIRWMPSSDSVAYSIFYLITLFLFIIPMAIGTSSFVHDIMSIIYTTSSYMSPTWDTIRSDIVLLIVSIGGYVILWKMGKIKTVSTSAK